MCSAGPRLCRGLQETAFFLAAGGESCLFTGSFGRAIRLVAAFPLRRALLGDRLGQPHPTVLPVGELDRLGSYQSFL